jgi:hypothetical protein
MNIGTRSILFGAHQFVIHPLFVAWAWWKLYGFPWDPRLWVAFITHDLGYWGKPNMDGPEGETHVEFGANLMTYLFGPEWGDFCRYHSRFYSKRDGKPFSRLCVADKLSVALEPWWLYLPRATLSGEVEEYMALSGYVNSDSKYSGEPRVAGKKYDAIKLRNGSRREWFKVMTDYLLAWVETHKDGRQDTWTPNITGEIQQ